MTRHPQAASAPAEHDGGGGYERKDLDPRLVLRFLFYGVVLLSVAAFFLMWGLLRLLGPGEEAQPSPQLKAVRIVPAPPRLQVNPARDLEALRKREDELLGSYGWVDREKGVVRIPIERAMDLLVKEGLPVREEKR